MSGGARATGAAPSAFADAHRALAMFAHAIAGRPLRLVPSALALESPRLPPPGEPGTIRVPGADSAGEPSPRALRVAVLRAVARADDVASAPPRRRGGGPRRAVLRDRLTAVLERARVDAAIPRRWPGAAADVERLRAAALRRLEGPAPRGPVRALLAALVAESLGAPRPTGPDPLGLRDAVLDAVAPLRAPGAAASDTARAVDGIVALLEAALRTRPAAGGATVRIAAPDGASDADAAPEGPRRDDGTADRGREPSGGRDAPRAVAAGAVGARVGEGEAPEAVTAAIPAGRDAPRDPAPRAPGSGGAPRDARPAPGGVLHDEWDYRAGRFLRAWCRVHERRLRGTETGFADDVRARHPELVRALRARFARMRPTGRLRVRRVGDGDELDLEGLVEAVVDRRAGRATDERLYVRRDPAVRDVAAAFLVDMSASTAVALPDPDAAARAAPAATAAWVDTGALLYGAYDDPPDEPAPGPRRRVIDVAKDALALMVDALATLGDACAVYGFSGDGRDDVEFHVVKAFEDASSASTWAALAAIEPRGSTRMGAAVRHAATRLARRPESCRVLIVVSDGYPQDTDYGPDRLDEEYGIQDTARALRDLERAGIRTFCVTIDPAGHDYLRRMCPPRRYLVIDDVPALPAALARTYAELTGRG
ncbi:MAG TPA: VWA domain-containing protein [Burkholderiaceae bacterium]|nr:VWA domain-containing protein [Burkholderiaceae bacterium]